LCATLFSNRFLSGLLGLKEGPLVVTDLEDYHAPLQDRKVLTVATYSWHTLLELEAIILGGGVEDTPE